MNGPMGTGRPALHLIDAAGRWSDRPVAEAANLWMTTWGHVAAMALSRRGLALDCLYLEYENVADPAQAVTVPAYTADDDRSYYEALAASATRDYLRVAVTGFYPIVPAPGQEARFPDGQGNVLTLLAESAGTVGMTGKPFSAAANSKLCGVAVVAAPDPGDRTRDVLFARSYFPTGQQQVKPPAGQFGVRYPLTFNLAV